MDSFVMNGLPWRILIVDQNDEMLVDRTNTLKVATTDPITRTVYISNAIYGNFFIKVLIHELSHCAMISFDLISEIHRMVKPEYWIDAEEWICNFMSDYGFVIYSSAFKAVGFDAWKYIPQEYYNFIDKGGIPYDKWS